MTPDDNQIINRTDTVSIPRAKTVNDLLASIKRVIAKPAVMRTLTSLTLANGTLTVSWKGLRADTLDADIEVDANDVLNNISLVELDTDSSTQANMALGEGVLFLERQGLMASHCLIGPETLLYEWVGINLRRAKSVIPERVLGTKVTVVDSLPDDVVIIAGGINPLDTTDLTHGIKINIPVND